MRAWKLKVKLLVAQLCLTFCYLMDCSPPASSDHGILQARILEWIAIPFSVPTQGSNPGLLHCRRILYHLRHQGSPMRTYCVPRTLKHFIVSHLCRKCLKYYYMSVDDLIAFQRILCNSRGHVTWECSTWNQTKFLQLPAPAVQLSLVFCYLH